MFLFKLKHPKFLSVIIFYSLPKLCLNSQVESTKKQYEILISQLKEELSALQMVC